MSMKKPFVSEIAPKTYVINEYGLTAMYLCVGSERALLIDTGCGVCELKEVVAELESLQSQGLWIWLSNSEHPGSVRGQESGSQCSHSAG